MAAQTIRFHNADCLCRPYVIEIYARTMHRIKGLNKLNVRLHYQCKRRLTCSPKRMERRPAVAAHVVTFFRLDCHGKGWRSYTNSAFFSSRRHHLPSRQSQVTQLPNSTERLNVDATIMRCFQAELFSRFLATVVVCRPCKSSLGKALTVHAKLQIWQPC